MPTNPDHTQDSSIDEPDFAEFSQFFNDTLYDGFDQGYYIGMMSGTSLDGLDAVVVSFDNRNHSSNDNKEDDKEDNNKNALTDPLQQNDQHIFPNIKLIATHSKDFDPQLKQVLLALCQPNGVKNLTNKEDEFEHYSELDWFGWASRVYAEFASKAVLELLEKAKLTYDDILAIGCHGQTVRHRPELNQGGFSLQLVDPNIIAERTGISVVTDFRRRDMAVGGQGAPLAPAFHKAMFANVNETRVLLNLGGIANISILPKPNNITTKEDPTVIGFDTGPANLLIDAWANLHTNQPYDKEGQLARSGTIIEPLLEQLLNHPYFALPAPKSTGREDFHLSWLENQLDEFAHHHPHLSYSPADVQATLSELTVVSACNDIKQHTHKYADKPTDKSTKAGSLYVCGGGAFNNYLLERLAHHLPNWTVMTTDTIGLEPTWMESVAFAWLARQTLMGDIGNLPAVTGAKKAVVLGQVCFG